MATLQNLYYKYVSSAFSSNKEAMTLEYTMFIMNRFKGRNVPKAVCPLQTSTDSKKGCSRKKFAGYMTWTWMGG